MAKRLLAFVLWGFMAWYAMGFVAYVMGTSDILGPFVGLAVGLLVFMDPLHVFWLRPKSAPDEHSTGIPAERDRAATDTDQVAA